MKSRILALSLAAEMMLVSSGCAIFRRKPKAPAPQPPAVVTPLPEPQQQTEPVKPSPTPPEPVVTAPPVAPPVAPPPMPVEVPKPEPKRRATRRSHGARPVPPPKTAPGELEAQAPAPPAPAAPRLGEVLSADKQGEFRAQLENNLAAARRILTALSSRQLTRQQSETASRVRAFITQAEGLRDSDLSTAVELSRRAMLLAEDLAGSVK